MWLAEWPGIERRGRHDPTQQTKPQCDGVNVVSSHLISHEWRVCVLWWPVSKYCWSIGARRHRARTIHRFQCVYVWAIGFPHGGFCRSFIWQWCACDDGLFYQFRCAIVRRRHTEIDRSGGDLSKYLCACARVSSRNQISMQLNAAISADLLRWTRCFTTIWARMCAGAWLNASLTIIIHDHTHTRTHTNPGRTSYECKCVTKPLNESVEYTILRMIANFNQDILYQPPMAKLAHKHTLSRVLLKNEANKNRRKKTLRTRFDLGAVKCGVAVKLLHYPERACRRVGMRRGLCCTFSRTTRACARHTNAQTQSQNMWDRPQPMGGRMEEFICIPAQAFSPSAAETNTNLA